MKFRKKPVIIEAVQWNGGNYEQMKDFITADFKYRGNIATAETTLIIPTLEGDMTANIGDYIIKGVNGEFYPCKPDIFKKTYEVIE